MRDVFRLSADRVSSSLVDTITGVFLYRPRMHFSVFNCTSSKCSRNFPKLRTVCHARHALYYLQIYMPDVQ
jgi:hypothetical protein